MLIRVLLQVQFKRTVTLNLFHCMPTICVLLAIELQGGPENNPFDKLQYLEWLVVYSFGCTRVMLLKHVPILVYFLPQHNCKLAFLANILLQLFCKAFLVEDFGFLFSGFC